MILLPTSSTLFPYTTLFRSYSNTAAFAPDLKLSACVLDSYHFHCSSRFRWAYPVVSESEIGRDTSELQSLRHLVCRLLLEKKKRDLMTYLHLQHLRVDTRP